MANKLDNNMIIRIVLIVLAGAILFALVTYYNSKQSSAAKTQEKFAQDSLMQRYSTKKSKFTEEDTEEEEANPFLVEEFQAQQKAAAAAAGRTEADQVKPAEESGNSDYRAVDFETQKLPSDCFPRDRLSAEDLLPNDAANSKWAQVNPAGQGDVSNQNFLTAGWAVGINTVSGSLRNANLQLRSEPPNPKGSWPIMNSTIEPDVLRKSFEVGGDC
jgi:hypothetical protein